MTVSDPPAAAASGPLSAQDQEVLARAAGLHRSLRRAASLARLNGMGYAVFGALSLMIAIPGGIDWIGAAVGVVLLGAGLVERTSGERLAHGDADAPKRLALAELVLLACIVAYGLAGLAGLFPGAQDLADASGLGQLDIQALMNRIVYPTVIAVAVLYQGGMARYFWKKRADVERYREEAPEWARRLVEELGGPAGG
jgi:hypothetical protein